MIIKTGIDLIEDSRIDVKNKLFLERIFHPSEIKLRKFASIFALKECIFKALEIKPCWHEVEIKYANNKPFIILSEHIKPKELISVDCSVSHENGLTIANVVMLLKKEN